MPITDPQMSHEERQARIDLAALSRLVALEGWDDLIFTHISIRVPGPEHHFLLNPFGMMFGEVTASSLVKVDVAGNPVDPGSAMVNPAGFVIHSAVHMAREDAHCVIHLHTIDGAALSAREEGLLPLTQHAMIIGEELAYHDYEGVAIRDEEKRRLQSNLGEANYLMLRNHGLLTVGKSIADAFLQMYIFENTCRIQLDALSGQTQASDLIQVNPQILSGVAHAMKVQTGGLGGAFVWPSLLRKLNRENPGYDV